MTACIKIIEIMLPVCYILLSIYTCVYWVHSRHEGTSAGGTDRVDVVVVQDDPGVGQGVQVGRRDLVGAVKTNIVPALQDRSSST